MTPRTPRAAASACASTAPRGTTARPACPTTGTAGGSAPPPSGPTPASVRLALVLCFMFSYLLPPPACECNGWSTKCRFNEELYMRSRRGGECLECGGNRAGAHCEECQPNHYISPVKDVQGRQPCLPCDCDPTGEDSSLECITGNMKILKMLTCCQAPRSCSVQWTASAAASPGSRGTSATSARQTTGTSPTRQAGK